MIKSNIAIGLIVCAVVVMALARNVRSATPTVVTVSMQRIAAESAWGKRATQELEALRKERAQGLAAKQKEVEEVMRKLAKPEALTPADRERLPREDARLRGEFQQMAQQAQVDFQTTQARLQGELRTHIAPMLADIAKNYSADAVLNGDLAVVWAAPGTDATAEVLRRLSSTP